MKIGIMTQPLNGNYGGLLQAWALQTYLEQEGHNVVIINKDYENTFTWGKFILNSKIFIADCILDIKSSFLRKKIVRPKTLPRKLVPVVKQHVSKFLNQYHHLSPVIRSYNELLKYCSKSGFECFIVGSDQCWRPDPRLPITNYFFDFAESLDVKRIAYAPSFGVDEWLYNKEQTLQCRSLLNKFDAISVREDTAIDLCKRYLHVEPIQVLDPTMLLRADAYTKIVIENNTPPSKGTLFYYILDMSEEKMNFIDRIARNESLVPFECNRKMPFGQYIPGHIEDSIFPPTEQWIRAYIDSKMIIVDSFHGTVFSILYNKDFWVLRNPGRGNTRMESLLRMFGLEDRFIDETHLEDFDYKKTIDWSAVNQKLEEWRIKSYKYLNIALNDA